MRHTFTLLFLICLSFSLVAQPASPVTPKSSLRGTELPGRKPPIALAMSDFRPLTQHHAAVDLVQRYLPAGPLGAESLRGFLLTKDNYQLTGYFNLLEYSPTGNQIVFTNDFGDIYSIHPMLVKGFGFSKDGDSFRFVSRFHEGQWFFLREEVAGQALSLYRLPDGTDQYVDDTMLRLFSQQPATYYFLYGDRKILPVPRAGFKRTLRDFFAEPAPSLAAMIGKRGYRYRDLQTIVREFNELKGRRRRRL